jgi:signal transduction histidine kinase/ActR/RegA family two-component response regulator
MLSTANLTDLANEASGPKEARSVADVRHARAVLSDLPVSAGEQRLAFAIIAILALAFVVAVPFARTPLLPVVAFIPAYEAALIIIDLITAVLLLGQFAQHRARALLVLAAGYLFDAAIIIPHALTFPGLFTSTGLLGAGSQSTAWLYMFWHGGFPLFVIAYSVLQARQDRASQVNRTRADAWEPLLAFGAVVAVVVALTALATAGQEFLPGIMQGHNYTPAMKFVVTTVWMLSLIALVMLWLKRPRSTLDLWLIVVMGAWICDIALSAVLNAGRFDLGFYAGRIYGLMAASFVLIALILETSGLYSRLARAAVALEHQTSRLKENVRQHIVEQRQTEAQLRQAQKMEAVGQLTGGIAHDFNNLLGVIIGNLDLLSERMQPTTPLKDLIEEALDGALRGAELVQRLLAFSRKQPLQPAPIDLNKRLPQIAGMLRRTLGENIELKLTCGTQLWPALADAAQTEEAVLNLAINARDAMPNGGTLTIETANVSLDDDYASQQAELTAGDYVLLAISDTGKGMSPAILERAFEPFFSTKEAGKGSGLGLSMVYGFVKQSEGHIKIYSEEGFGTTVKIYLPRANAIDSAEAQTQLAESHSARGHELILVVDDNERMLAVTLKQLADLGYRTLASANAKEALSVLEEHPEIDLLFTDVIMPGGMTGCQLAREVRKRRPTLKILLTSGYTAQAVANGCHDLAGLELLQKPFRKSELAAKLRHTLDS